MLRQSLSVIAALALAAGCEDKKEPIPPPPVALAAPVAPPPPAPAPAPTAKGDVKGSVKLNGKPPVMAELKRSTDPFCGKTKMKDPEVVGNLGNVLVRINGAPPAEPPAAKAEIDQKNCMYEPRVQGIVAGQTLAIKNGDPVLHNVHTYKGSTTLFNQAQVPNTPEIDKKLDQNGALLKFKCDVHNWMTGYVWVQNNPYFAVTKDDGSFEIKGVPAGKYEIEAWHERFGSKKGEVTVAAGKPAEVKLEYAPTDK